MPSFGFIEMIPTALDGELATIEASASVILTQLRTMAHAAPGDLPRMRARLRETLQAFADDVMATAREAGP